MAPPVNAWRYAVPPRAHFQLPSLDGTTSKRLRYAVPPRIRRQEAPSQEAVARQRHRSVPGVRLCGMARDTAIGGGRLLVEDLASLRSLQAVIGRHQNTSVNHSL